MEQTQPQPKIQRVPEIEDVVVIRCQIIDGIPRYIVDKHRVRYLTESGIIIHQPQAEPLSEAESLAHMLECAKSMGMKAIVERDGVLASAGGLVGKNARTH